MQMKYGLIVLMVFGFVLMGEAQSTRDVTSPKPPAPKYQAFKKEKKGFLWGLFKKKKKTEIKTHAEEVADFRKRMAEVQKQKAKAAKEADKPQYTNPLYFGHKKPPKKRPNGKKKFCKECGLWH
ncbi:hypothetical protein [Marinoscillum sp.]|uniref:hypothetical protein n=1 Tax=Marinoscillum sp. TaxID=2024838 RepID=UPI003BAAABB6